jgi:hypothetical protein
MSYPGNVRKDCKQASADMTQLEALGSIVSSKATTKPAGVLGRFASTMGTQHGEGRLGRDSGQMGTAPELVTV